MIEPTADALQELLERVPAADVTPSAAVVQAIEHSVTYLRSPAALASIDADPYWPKWDSPWWHMLLLEEVGEVRRIAEPTLSKMIERMNALPVRVFPIPPDDVPAGVDPCHDATCHCALGCLCRVLSGFGVDVDVALPWAKPWFVRYQMADGGLNCDGHAYLQRDECPSSMVGTIAPFEAMLAGDPARWSEQQRGFLERAAAFLIDRRLLLGSHTRYNAEERASAERWLEPCWPRFYFYDVLRGLRALVRWAEATDRPLPIAAVSPVVRHLVERSPDGVVRLGREAVAGVMSRTRASGAASVRGPASRFPLLDATSVVGQPSAYATREWAETRRALSGLIARGRLVA